MYRNLIVLALCVLCEGAQAQNLVPNGSFEDYILCPSSIGQWAQVVGWTSPYTESADYYNACASGVVCSVPLNTAGYQYPADGDGYMGIFTYATLIAGHYREVIAAEFSQPLIPGVPVYISFKASPGGFGSNVNNSATMAAKGPGVNLYTNMPSDWQSYLFPNSAAVDMSGVLSDTSTWVTISGIYVPDSAYNWLAITNYFENSLSQPQVLDSVSPANSKAYAFIDDVCVSYDPLFCSGGTGIDLNGPRHCSLFGSLINDRLVLHASRSIANAELILTDVQGRVLWTGAWPRGAMEVNEPMPMLSSAMYFLIVQTQQGIPQVLRMVQSVHP